MEYQEHGTPADPHLFSPAAVAAGKHAREQEWPKEFLAGCVLCHRRIQLGYEPAKKWRDGLQ